MFFLGGGGAVADAYPLVSVESDPAVVSGLHTVVSVLPVAGFEFPAVFSGKVAFDALAWALARRGFGGSFAEANRRASPVGLCCPGCDPGDEVSNEILEYMNGIKSIK